MVILPLHQDNGSSKRRNDVTAVRKVNSQPPEGGGFGGEVRSAG